MKETRLDKSIRQNGALSIIANVPMERGRPPQAPKSNPLEHILQHLGRIHPIREFRVRSQGPQQLMRSLERNDILTRRQNIFQISNHRATPI